MSSSFITVDGMDYDLEKAQDAIRASQLLVLAYAIGSSQHGGDDHIDWSDVDTAHEVAKKSLSKDQVRVIEDVARSRNGVSVSRRRNRGG